MIEIQAVLFDKNEYTSKDALQWLKKHELSPIKRVHVTKNYLRYRINEPTKYTKMRTIKKDGIDIIIGIL
jgi:hypothetical protein